MTARCAEDNRILLQNAGLLLSQADALRVNMPCIEAELGLQRLLNFPKIGSVSWVRAQNGLIMVCLGLYAGSPISGNYCNIYTLTHDLMKATACPSTLSNMDHFLPGCPVS